MCGIVSWRWYKHLQSCYTYTMEELERKIDAQNAKLEAIYTSVEKTRRYFQIILWATVIMFILPLIGLIFVIPMVMSTYTQALNGLI